MLSKTLRPYYAANRNYGNPIYSVIAHFLRVNNMIEALYAGFNYSLLSMPIFSNQTDDEASEAV